MQRRLPVYKVWREYNPSGVSLHGKPRFYSYTIIETIPQTNDPQHHIYKRYNNLYCLRELTLENYIYLQNLRIDLRLDQIISFIHFNVERLKKLIKQKQVDE
jgi:hypothetical protein